MKKILSVVMSLIIAFAIIPIFTINVQAADHKIEKAIEWAISTANDDTHGYSMSSRNGPNYDCSSFVSYAFKNGGFSFSGVPNSSSIISVFTKIGFKSYKKGAVTPRRGDIYVQPGSHVELYLGDGYCAGAHENTDGKSGDSKGDEIDVRPLSKCSWCRNKKYTYILRYEGPETYTYSFSYDTLSGNDTEGKFTVEYEKSFTINHSATKIGYTLAGWNVQRERDNKWFTPEGWLTEEQIYQKSTSKTAYQNGTTLTFNDNWTSSYNCDTNFTLYAVWTPKKYALTFNVNGGSNAPDNQIKTHGFNLTLSNKKPSRSGYNFLGWAETANATVPTYLPGSLFYSNADTTLYAVWQLTVDASYFEQETLNTNTLAAYKLLLSGGTTSNGDETIADYNNDGTVNTDDLSFIKSHLVGIQTIQ